jgi:ankyrin repeat protein
MRINNNRENRNQTPLYRAAENDNAELISLLLKHADINVNQVSGPDNMTPLCIAAQQGHQNVVAILLANPQVDINKPNAHGATPLLLSVERENIEVVKLLLKEATLNINHADALDYTALHYAALSCSEEIPEALLSHPEIDVNKAANIIRKTPLHCAIEARNIAAVKSLLKHPNIDINTTNFGGQTAIHYAIYFKQLEVVRLLLEQPNVDLDRLDIHNKTALESAGRFSFKIKKLLKACRSTPAPHSFFLPAKPELRSLAHFTMLNHNDKKTVLLYLTQLFEKSHAKYLFLRMTPQERMSIIRNLLPKRIAQLRNYINLAHSSRIFFTHTQNTITNGREELKHFITPNPNFIPKDSNNYRKEELAPFEGLSEDLKDHISSFLFTPGGLVNHKLTVVKHLLRWHQNTVESAMKVRLRKINQLVNTAHMALYEHTANSVEISASVAEPTINFLTDLTLSVSLSVRTGLGMRVGL